MVKQTLILTFDVGSRSLKTQLEGSESENEGLDFTSRCRIQLCHLTVVVVSLL